MSQLLEKVRACQTAIDSIHGKTVNIALDKKTFAILGLLGYFSPDGDQTATNWQVINALQALHALRKAIETDAP